MDDDGDDESRYLSYVVVFFTGVVIGILIMLAIG